MNISDVPKWIGMAVLAAALVGSLYVNDYKLAQAEEAIAELEEDKERQIRMDERQKAIQEDVEDIKELLEELRDR